LNEQLKCLEQRIETQLAILAEIQEYFRRRADVELDYAKNLDNLHKQIGQKRFVVFSKLFDYISIFLFRIKTRKLDISFDL